MSTGYESYKVTACKDGFLSSSQFIKDNEIGAVNCCVTSIKYLAENH